jgi:hypothetical protein
LHGCIGAWSAADPFILPGLSFVGELRVLASSYSMLLQKWALGSSCIEVVDTDPTELLTPLFLAEDEGRSILPNVVNV